MARGPTTNRLPYVRDLEQPERPAASDGFFDDITRGYKQKAAYVSADFDLSPNRLTLTLGTRYSSIETSEVGSYVGSFGCQLITVRAAQPLCESFDLHESQFAGLDRTYSGSRAART